MQLKGDTILSSGSTGLANCSERKTHLQSIASIFKNLSNRVILDAEGLSNRERQFFSFYSPKTSI